MAEADPHDGSARPIARDCTAGCRTSSLPAHAVGEGRQPRRLLREIIEFVTTQAAHLKPHERMLFSTEVLESIIANTNACSPATAPAE